MLPTNNETYEFDLYKRIKNSKYEYEKAPCAHFCGRPANTLEVKTYRLLKGVNGNNDAHFVVASNLPEEVDIGDQVYYLGKIWTIRSVGYYFDANRIVNARSFSEKQIIDKCPKGLNIE